MKQAQLGSFHSWFIVVVFAVVAVFWLLILVATYKMGSMIGEQDWKGGIKPVIERLWCGTPGCTK